MTRRARPISNICAGRGFCCAHCGHQEEPYRFPSRSSVVLRCRACKKEHLADRGNGHAVEPHTAVDMVLGRLSADDADAGHVGPAIPAAVGSVALRDGVHAASQAPRWHGEAERDTIGGEHPVEIDECLVGARRAAKAVACITRSPSSARLKSARASRKRRAPDATRIAAARRPNARSMRAVAPASCSRQERRHACFFVRGNIAMGATIMTDGAPSYRELADLGFDHQPLVWRAIPRRRKRICR